jgi:hypothetical protein
MVIWVEHRVGVSTYILVFSLQKVHASLERLGIYLLKAVQHGCAKVAQLQVGLIWQSGCIGTPA